MRVETIGNTTLYLGDCRDILDSISADAMVTDPPYGVNFTGSSTKHGKDIPNGYASFDDTSENIQNIIVPLFVSALSKVKRAAVTPGIRCHRMYPTPDGEGVIWYPSGANSGPWGFVTHQPILYYGKCPFLARSLGSRPSGFQSVESARPNGHPCPKPIGQTKWMVDRVSILGETVLDPFMGSGTTGVACVEMDRKFIGVELDPGYFDIACKRIALAVAESKQRLFPLDGGAA